MTKLISDAQLLVVLSRLFGILSATGVFYAGVGIGNGFEPNIAAAILWFVLLMTSLGVLFVGRYLLWWTTHSVLA